MRLLISVGPGCSFPALMDTDDGWLRVGLAWFGRCRVWWVVLAGRLGWCQGTREGTRGTMVPMD